MPSGSRGRRSMSCKGRTPGSACRGSGFGRSRSSWIARSHIWRRSTSGSIPRPGSRRTNGRWDGASLNAEETASRWPTEGTRHGTICSTCTFPTGQSPRGPQANLPHSRVAGGVHASVPSTRRRNWPSWVSAGIFRCHASRGVSWISTHRLSWIWSLGHSMNSSSVAYRHRWRSYSRQKRSSFPFV